MSVLGATAAPLKPCTPAHLRHRPTSPLTHQLSVPLAAAASRAPRPNPWDLQRQKSARAAVSRVFTPVQVPSNPAGAARTFTPVPQAGPSGSRATKTGSPGTHQPTTTLALAPPAPAPKDKPPVDQEG
ncbi:hypothetical protein PtB15_10B462 [Puccinia triticina]|nr:hypothetical protein PtB15_10B462 [Puccinia triticina]